jgi:hypothetical protein
MSLQEGQINHIKMMTIALRRERGREGEKQGGRERGREEGRNQIHRK